MRVENRAHQLAELQYVEHLEVAPCLPPLKLGHILPETIDPGQCHQPLRVYLPCVPGRQHKEKKHHTRDHAEKEGMHPCLRYFPILLETWVKQDFQHWLFVYALQSCFRYFHPVIWVLLASLEEVSHQISSLLGVVRVNVEARDAMLYNLSWSSMECCKSRKSTGHGLHDSETKCFIKGWL